MYDLGVLLVIVSSVATVAPLRSDYQETSWQPLFDPSMGEVSKPCTNTACTATRLRWRLLATVAMALSLSGCWDPAGEDAIEVARKEADRQVRIWDATASVAEVMRSAREGDCAIVEFSVDRRSIPSPNIKLRRVDHQWQVVAVSNITDAPYFDLDDPDWDNCG